MAYNLAKALREKGTDLLVLAQSHAESSAFDSSQPFPIVRVRLGSPTSLVERFNQKRWLVEQLRSLLKEFKPDCVLCTHWDPAAYLIKFLSPSIPYFVVAHGMELMQLPKNRILRGIKGVLRSVGLKGAQMVFAVSTFTRDRLIRLGVSPLIVKVIPNGVEFAEGNNASVRMETQPGHPKILTVSRLVPRKGHDLVLEALTSVIKYFPSLQYQIVGEGPERDNLERLTDSLGLRSHVVFLGRVKESEKDALLCECDLFVLPCRDTPNDFEGFGIAFLEAMAFGKPVIAGRSGGVIDVVKDGETGVLVEPNNAKALADAVLALLRDPARGKELGLRGAMVARELYRWDLIAQEYLHEINLRVTQGNSVKD